MNNQIRILLIAALLFTLFFSNNFILFVLVYVFIALIMIVYTIMSKRKTKIKVVLSCIYAAIMIFQLTFNATVTFDGPKPLFDSIRDRIFGLLMVLAPFAVSRMFSRRSSSPFYLPSAEEAEFTFNEIVDNIQDVKNTIEKGKECLSKENIDEIASDIPRHNSFKYINKGSLTDAYFDAADKTMGDPKLYIVISKTGSPASEVISLFTQKQYNHASLSFDRELKTIISYNGGERVSPPGLNREMISYFNRKPGSSILVYSLQITEEQKQVIIDQIREINNEGNAYNLLGLVFKHSFRPNIMFCSQFVYKMLKIAGAHYFEKKDKQVKPTDLIEMDYYRKLRYEYEIRFNEGKERNILRTGDKLKQELY